MTTSQIDGRPIIDARKSLTLHVTLNDIKSADLREPGNCAVARACRRELKVAEARIHLGRVYIRQNKGNWQRYHTPRQLRTEIIAFDRGGSFEPGEYTLAAPPPSHQHNRGKRLGPPPRYKQARYNPKRKPRTSPTVVKNVRGGPAS